MYNIQRGNELPRLVVILTDIVVGNVVMKCITTKGNAHAANKVSKKTLTLVGKVML